MISTTIYLDIRSTKSGEVAPLKIAITKQSKTAYLSLGIKVLQEQWDKRTKKIVDHPRKNNLNYFLETRKSQVDGLILELQLKGELTKLSSTQIKNLIQLKLSPKEVDKNLFLNRFISFANSRNATRTKEIYLNTIKEVKSFDKDIQNYIFEDIKKEWIVSFINWLGMKGVKKNTINIHLRNIRAVFNDAIDNDITTNYPFRKIDMRPEETLKRSLSLDEVRLLFSINVEKWQEKYVDYFKLSLFLIGINPADLLNCSKESLIDGRLIYKRAKTGRLYSIKVEPEAMFLIEKYKGKNRLVSFAENHKDYRTFVGKADKALKKIGKKIYVPNKNWKQGSKKHRYKSQYISMFPSLSIYWARHTWATLAFLNGIPEEVIAASLGHIHGNRTTSIYINKALVNIDDANRKIIDLVSQQSL